MPQTIDNMIATWNNAATTFTAIKMNVTDTASNASSLLMDLQVGGSSRFKVSKDGTVTFAGGSYVSAAGTLVGVSDNSAYAGSGAFFGSTRGINWSSTTAWSGTADLFLTRRAAANLRLGAADTTGTTAPTPQTLSVQSWTSSTNNNQPGANFTITGSQGTGTGAGGSIIFQVAPAGGTSNGVQNALATALTIASDKNASFAGRVGSDFGYVFGSPQFYAPAIASNTGFQIVNNTCVALYGNGTPLFAANSLASAGITIASTTSLGWTETGSSITSNPDVKLWRDAANTLALRNGAAAQAFRVYNTTDGTNGEWLSIDWKTNSNILGFYMQTSGSGTNTRQMSFLSGGDMTFEAGANSATAQFKIATNNTFRWLVNGSGHFLASADNAYDIGTSSGSRPRDIYAAGFIKVVGRIEVGATAQVMWSGSTKLTNSANGQITLHNNAETDFGRLNFGGTTSSFPALKRSSTALETKLADDSAYAPHAMQYLDVTDGVTAPASATGRARIYVDTADGDLKVIFADGTVKTIVTDT